jgi:UDP-N-acetylmuramoyl-tripeptide--D-alanyl-D-alanine ligase
VLIDDPEAAAIATTAAPVPTTCCATHEELSQALLATVQPGDRILFKASNSVGLERIVQQISQTWGQAG